MSFKSATVDNGGASAGYDPAPIIPSTTLEGDALVVIVATTDNAPSIAPTPPSGWTLQASGSMPIDGTAAVSPHAVWIYMRDGGASAADEAAAGSGTYQWVFAGSEEQYAVMINADPATWGQFAKNELTGTRTTINAPSVTTTVVDELVFHCALKDGGVAFTSFPSGTSLAELNLVVGDTGGAGGAARGVWEEFGIGATGTKAFTHASEESNGYTFSLVPDVAGIDSLDSAYGIGADELDFDDIDVDINGAEFGATIGASDVYLSPNDLLSEAGEVDITAAVNTWSDTQINLDFSQLSQGVIDDLHTMGPGARFIIVNVGGVPATTEYFLAVALHRPKAFEMQAGNLVPGTTTSRLTGMTGTFGGGRAEETTAQNPSTTDTNVADNGNREDLWSMWAKTGAREVTHDFRVLYDGVVADTITQTPQVIISALDHAITGSISITSTLTANLKGVGVLSSSIPGVMTVTADLTGVGTLASTIAGIFTITAAPRAVGVLSSTIPGVFTVAANLKGKGVLSSTIPIVFTLTSNLTAGLVFGDLVKQDKVKNISATSVTADLGSNPTAGNLLIAAYAHQTGSLTLTPPTGFTAIEIFDTFGGLAASLCYKISDGTEQTIGGTWSSAGAISTHYHEYVWGEVPPSVTSNEDETNVDTIVNSQSSGALTPVTITNIMIAAHGTNSGPNNTTGQAIDGIWFEDSEFDDVVDTAELKISRLVNAAISSQEATHSDTDVGDRMYGAIASFDIPVIIGSIAIVFTVTADLKGKGVLSSTIPSVFTVVGDVTAAANNAITSSISITSALTADLKGKGVLTSAIPAVLTVTSDLTGVGVLSSTISITFALTGNLTGVGSLSSTIPAVFTLTADLKGQGVLSSTIPIVFTVTSDLTGIGSLSSTIPAVFTITGNVTAASDDAIASNISIVFGLAADLKGVGSLTSSIPAVFTITPDLTGVGTLSSTIASVFTLTADLKGVGVLASTIPAIFTVSGVVTAAADNSIASSISITFGLTGNLTGIGSLSSTIPITFDLTANLTGVGSLSSTIPAVFTISATPRAVGVLESTIPIVFTLTGALTVSPQITSTIPITFALAGALTGIGQIAGSISITFTLTGNLAAERIFEWVEICPDPSDFSNIIDASDTWDAVAKDTSTWTEESKVAIDIKRCA